MRAAGRAGVGGWVAVRVVAWACAEVGWGPCSTRSGHASGRIMQKRASPLACAMYVAPGTACGRARNLTATQRQAARSAQSVRDSMTLRGFPLAARWRLRHGAREGRWALKLRCRRRLGQAPALPSDQPGSCVARAAGQVAQECARGEEWPCVLKEALPSEQHRAADLYRLSARGAASVGTSPRMGWLPCKYAAWRTGQKLIEPAPVHAKCPRDIDRHVSL